MGATCPVTNTEKPRNPEESERKGWVSEKPTAKRFRISVSKGPETDPPASDAVLSGIPSDSGASLMDHLVKTLPAVQETWVQSLGREDPLEKGMATHSSIFAWRIPWTEESGWLCGVTKSQTRLSD